MKGGSDAALMFEDLKSGLAAPLAGMGISFSSSLFGLAGSLVLGFLDLQAGQAQNRFYNELEDWLSTTVVEPRRRADAAPRGAPQRHRRGAGLDRLTVVGAGAAAARRTPRRWPISPRASRRWCSTCAPSSSSSATGSRRRPAARPT